MLTKEECIKRLKEARYTIQPFCYINEAIDYAIKELQNTPLKFEELKENMWVWDNKNKLYVQIEEYFDENDIIFLRYYEDSYNSNCERTLFEENRFYRKEVNNDE